MRHGQLKMGATMASRTTRHLKDEFKDDIVIINAARELSDAEFKVWMVLSAAQREWLTIESKQRNDLHNVCGKAKARFRQILRELALKGYVETQDRSRHKAATIVLRRRPLRLTGRDSIVNPAGGVVGRALAKYEEAEGERLIILDRSSESEASASDSTEPPSVSLASASDPEKALSVSVASVSGGAVSVSEASASAKKPEEKSEDDPSVSEASASSELSAPRVESISKSPSGKTKRPKTKRTPTEAGTASRAPKGEAKPKGPTKEAMKEAKARRKAERAADAAKAKATRDGGVKWDRVEKGGEVTFNFDAMDADEADYVRKMVATTSSPKRKRVLDRYANEVARQFTNFRNYVKPGFVLDPALMKHAKSLAVSCIAHGLTPVQVFRYWHEEGAAWAKLDDPSSSLTFMSRAANVEQVVAAGPTRGKAAAEAKGKTKIAGYAYDPDDIHPGLRSGLEEAGFDLSTGSGIDGDEPWSDAALMTVQRSAETLASGKSLWMPMTMRKMARWAAENLFGGIPG